MSYRVVGYRVARKYMPDVLTISILCADQNWLLFISATLNMVL